jgi:3,4-dihydroxybenzoyl-citryl-spermidine/N-citryl-spermidine--spermidine ligase
MTAGQAVSSAVGPKRAKETFEERVSRQLLEAFIFEGLLPADALLFGGAEMDDGFAPVTLKIAGFEVCFEARMGAFDRCEIRKGSAADAETGRPLGLDFAFALADTTGADPEKLAALQKELTQTVRLCEWNLSHLRIDQGERRSFRYEDLDPSIHEGHPYHPCFKARSGFSDEDHHQFGPEAGGIFELAWLAVRRDRLRVEFPGEERVFWTEEIGDETLHELERRMKERQIGFDTHGLLPVHPWQWRTVQPRYETEMHQGILLPLGSLGDRYRPTQSLRTLMNSRDPRKAYLKLPMSLVNTSSLRTFEAPLVCTAPHVSNWLSEVVGSDRFFRDTAPLTILKEYAAAIYQPAASDECCPWKTGELGCIWRESVRSTLEAGECAVPFNALATMECDGRPFIDHWVHRFGLACWLNRLLEVTIPPVWRLLAEHGIAIEAHAQNLVIVHQNGWPLRLIARDFHESLEYVVNDRLNESSHLRPDFAVIDAVIGHAPPDRFYRMASLESLRELFMDTVFIYNLVDLERLLREQYQFPETSFWNAAGQFLSAPFTGKISDLIGHRAPRLRTESLMRKKLFGGRADEFHHPVSNPFHP